MKVASKWTFLFFFIFLLNGCSLWNDLRHSSTSEDEKLKAGPVEFNAYHNIRPSRSAGGKFYKIRFLSPKSLREISFEFVNHKVKLSKLELIKSSGKVVSLKGFRPRFLNRHQKNITFRNLSQSRDVVAVRLKAEGYESNNVLFTVSFFSPDGFVPQEQGKALALKSFDPSRKLGSLAAKKIPKCLIQNAQFSHIVFESQQLSSLTSAEKKYFCRRFLPQLQKLMEDHDFVSQFLRTGEDLEKPLVSLGNNFSYDRYENHLVFPFKLKSAQFSRIAKRLESHYKKPRRKASRGLSQENDRQYGLKQSYQEYMNSSNGPDLSYDGSRDTGGDTQYQKECMERFVELGLHATHAKSQCEDVVGYEREHLACVEFLTDQYILVEKAHHYCLEANGKLSHYKPCMKKLISMDMNHYDSNIFCQQTPVEYIQDQLQCVEEMSLTGQSQYKSVRICQKAWGHESSLIRCLREAQESNNPKKAAERCDIP